MLKAPRLAIAFALLILVALAATLAYTGFLVIGVLADYLGTGRFVAGLLVGIVLARFPWISQGRPRMVGVLPKPLRRPAMVILLALCLLRFAMQGDTVSAVLAGFAIAFIVGFSWLRAKVFSRIASSAFNFAPGGRAPVADNTVIEGEFRERKE